MNSLEKKEKRAEDYSKKTQNFEFTSPLSLGLLEANPFAKNPVEAILFQANLLLIESGMKEPPFNPIKYSSLRNVKKVLYKDMNIDGRLIPSNDGFIVELKKDRPIERINFTLAHEISHTFFYEAVPTIKYRTVDAKYILHDEEEEKLCDIAASELLMPTAIFSNIAKDFVPSPKSLVGIARIFETSITSTVIKTLSLNLWKAGFILWKIEDKQLTPKWYATPNYHLSYNPKFELINTLSTSVYHTAITGETSSDFEWYSLNGGFRKGFFESVRLNSKTVLSCITTNSNST